MRSGLALMLLILATLACTLTADDNETTAPTVVTTGQVVGQNPTQSPTRGIDNTTPTRTNPTATSAPIAATPNNCTPRTDWPILTVASGDTLSRIAQRVGSTIAILQQANCISDPNSLRVGQQIRVPSIPPATVTSAVTVTNTTTPCTNPWFFQFNTTFSETRCPTPVDVTDAVGHDFEGGRAYWYKATAAYPQNLIYIIYNDGTWAVYDDTWNTSLPIDDPSIVPPAGRFQPVRGIGKVWREQPGVKTKLGWAYEAEYAFRGRRQEPQPPLTVNYADLYIDHGTRNLVVNLRRLSGASGERVWTVAGGY